MKLMNVLKGILAGLYRSVRRFPATIFLSASVAVMLIVISELQPINDAKLNEMLLRIVLILALGMPISLCIRLFVEKSDERAIPRAVLYYTFGAILLLLYYYFLLPEFNMISITRYTGISLALYLCFLFIPYLPQRERYEMYITKIFSGFFITLMYSVILYLGLAAILFTVDKLLAVSVASKTYYYTFLLVAFIFAPSYFLAGIPQKDEKQDVENYPRLFKVLLLYIVMPLLTVYTAILYIYLGKTIVTWQWPVGLISHLVLWYSVITVSVIFFITPIRDKYNWAGMFSTWIPKIVLPVLVMMFISMGIRVNAYGVTESRYYVIALGLWVSGAMAYISFSKKPRNIMLVISLSIISLISVTGPLSSYSISVMSQNSRFENILARNNMLREGVIKVSPAAISDEDKNEISSILNYFNSSHSLKEVRCLPENFRMGDMEKVFGFQFYSARPLNPEGSFYFMREQAENVIDISGYDYMFDTRSLYGKGQAKDSEINLIYNPERADIKISYKGNVAYERDLKPFVKNLAGKYGSLPGGSTLSPEEMTFTDVNGGLTVKYVFFSISGSRDINTGDIVVYGPDFYMLVKIK